MSFLGAYMLCSGSRRNWDQIPGVCHTDSGVSSLEIAQIDQIRVID